MRTPGAVAVPALLGLVVVAVIVGLAVGARPLPPADVVSALLGRADAVTSGIVLEQRLPRTVIGLCAGAALGVAGSLMQALTRNPLADPGILGINAGAAFAAVLAAVVVGTTDLSEYMWAAFAGAGLAAVGVYLLGGTGPGSSSPVRLTLAGVAVTAALTALTQVLVFSDTEAFDEFRTWIAGSLQNRWFEHLGPVAPFLVVGLVAALAAVPGLDALALGGQVGRALGVPLRAVRGLSVLAVTLLAGSATALVGPLAFVGLAAPHLARAVRGTDLRQALLPSALIGAALVVAADVLARVVVSAEAPVGAVVTVAGAPLFVALVRARRIARL